MTELTMFDCKTGFLKACAELLLQIILRRDDLRVQSVQVQHEIKNLQGRSVRLDIAAVDTEGKLYNVEVQRDDRGAGVKRVRYNASLMDANITKPSADCEGLPETYVIFITERDVLKGGLPIYHIDRTIKEMNHVLFGDETHIIYVNLQIKDETKLGRLMHDFSCTDADDMTYSILADRVRYFKEDREGVTIMCKAIEDMLKDERKKMAKRMLEDGELSPEKIAKYSELTPAEVAALAKQ